MSFKLDVQSQSFPRPVYMTTCSLYRMWHSLNRASDYLVRQKTALPEIEHLQSESKPVFAKQESHTHCWLKSKAHNHFDTMPKPVHLPLPHCFCWGIAQLWTAMCIANMNTSHLHFVITTQCVLAVKPTVCQWSLKTYLVRIYIILIILRSNHTIPITIVEFLAMQALMWKCVCTKTHICTYMC